MKINQNLWNPWTCMGYICFEQKICYLLYSKRSTPHRSVLQRDINCSNRENPNRGFPENIAFDQQNTGQSQPFGENLTWSHSHSGNFAPDTFPKPLLETQFLAGVLESIFPKVWDSFLETYLTIWRIPLVNFDETSIPTRLKRSSGERKT